MKKYLGKKFKDKELKEGMLRDFYKSISTYLDNAYDEDIYEIEVVESADTGQLFSVKIKFKKDSENKVDHGYINNGEEDWQFFI